MRYQVFTVSNVEFGTSAAAKNTVFLSILSSVKAALAVKIDNVKAKNLIVET
jgi:hypothetical protein